MDAQRITGIGSVRRGVPAVVVSALVAAALAGGGPAAAAARPGYVRAPRAGPTAGVISTVAGGVGGPAKATNVAIYSCGVSFGAGHLFSAGLSTVRKVTPGTDRLTTPAGGGGGPLGDGGPAVRASLDACSSAVDHSGNLVIADNLHDRIRVVAARTGTFYGQAMTAGDIYTVA